jgi:hypothetical protein
MDPLWTIPLAGLLIAVFAGIIALLDYLGTKSKQQALHHKKA